MRGREPNENDLRSTRHTLLLLWREKYLYRLPYYKPQTDSRTYVYGLTRKALRKFPLHPLAKSFEEHSILTLPHELEISFFHMYVRNLCDDYGLALEWDQTEEDNGVVFADARFKITDPETGKSRNFRLEVEKTKLSKYLSDSPKEKKKPRLIRKLIRYADYFDHSGEKFYCIVIQPTYARREHLLPMMKAEGLNRPMFWVTNETAYKENIEGKVFSTWRDSKETTYSFLDL